MGPIVALSAGLVLGGIYAAATSSSSTSTSTSSSGASSGNAKRESDTPAQAANPQSYMAIPIYSPEQTENRASLSAVDIVRRLVV